jgi:hypothetical protein
MKILNLIELPYIFDDNSYFLLSDRNLVDVVNKLLILIYQLEKSLETCIGIYMQIISINNLDKVFKDTDKERSLIGHAVAFIKCDNKMYFYDDNGILINENVIEHDDISNVPEFRKNAALLLVEFDWITFLRQKIISTRPKLMGLLDAIWDRSLLPMLRDIILEFSEFIHFQKESKHTPIGKDYLRDYFINGFNIITVEDLTTEENYKLLTEDINTIYSSTYNNPRSKLL